MASTKGAWIALCCSVLTVAVGVGCSDANDEVDNDGAGTSGPPILNLDTSANSGSNASGSGGSSGSSNSGAGTSAGGSEAEVLGVNGEPGSCRSLQIED